MGFKHFICGICMFCIYSRMSLFFFFNEKTTTDIATTHQKKRF
jgi:hypothetical protein